MFLTVGCRETTKIRIHLHSAADRDYSLVLCPYKMFSTFLRRPLENVQPGLLAVQTMQHSQRVYAKHSKTQKTQ